MIFRLAFTDESKEQLEALKKDPAKLKKVKKCLGLLQKDPKYPGLNSHKYRVMKTEDGKDIWESYVENNTPAAWRVFWHYGPSEDQLTIFSITQHP